jgi:HD-like signal output (HDOD) protein/DNA-binding NarL/FixJ family response regulator
MKSVMVVDDLAVIREPIAAALRNAGYKATCAGGAAEALSMVRKNIPDLILLDLSMPKVDGMTMLRALRALPSTASIPVILLTATSDKQMVLKAANWGVRDYLLKSQFRLSELLERVKLRLTATEAGSEGDAVPHATVVEAIKPVRALNPNAKPERLLARHEAITRAETALDMKALPGVAMEVISQAASPRADSASLATLIGRDSMLAAKVLQVANSCAYTTGRGMVATLPEAVRNIGCDAVRNVAASLSIFEAMPSQSDGGFNLLRCWQHSLGVAVLCERLASLSDICPSNVAYLVGLCHDLGEILFRTTFATEYRQVMDFQAETGQRRESIEREMLGVTHNELVGVILNKLGLPRTIREPIDAMRSATLREKNPAARLLAMANVYANGLTLCESVQSSVAPIAKADCHATTGQNDPAGPDGAGFRGEIIAMTSVLARLSAAEERELNNPLIPPCDSRVWLIRDRTLSELDPIAALLSTVAQVKVVDHLPDKSEVEEIDRMVVLGQSAEAAGAGGAEVAKLQEHFAPESILWLTGDANAPPSPSASLQPRPYPITLQEIQEFLTPVSAASGK